MKEIEGELAKIDPAREIEIGNYRLDAQGNIIHKKVIRDNFFFFNFYIIVKICFK